MRFFLSILYSQLNKEFRRGEYMSTYIATKPLVPSEKENTPQGVCEKIIEIARKNFSEDELGDALRGERNELISKRDKITD